MKSILQLVALVICFGLQAQIKFEQKNYLDGQSNTSAGVSWIDFNRDSYPDLFISNAQKQNNTLYLNKKGKGFEQIQIDGLTNDLSSTSAAAWADYDNDGDQDVVFANQHGEDNYLFRNERGTFKKRQTFAKGDTYHLNWVDYNNNGSLDLFIPNAQTGVTQLFENKKGVFKPVSNVISELKGFHSGSAWFDINNDNFPDLYLATAGSPDSFIKSNKASGLLVSDKTILGDYASSTSFTAGISLGDFDGDLDFDGFIANINNQKNTLLINEQGQFSELSDMNDASSSWNGIWGDFDNDGDLDLFVTNYDQPNTLYENNRGELKKISSYSKTSDLPLFSSGVAWGDYNRDGSLDLVLANWENKPNTFLEGVPNGNNWIIFKLKGKDSNKDGIGAVVRISYEMQGETQSQIALLQSNMGLRSYPERIIHFGLGKFNGPVDVEVKWPNGLISNYKLSKINTFYSMNEGNKKLKRIP